MSTNIGRGPRMQASRFAAWIGLGVMLVLLGPFGCSVGAKEICNLKCDCEGCSEPEYDDCMSDVDATIVKAKGYGCEDQYSDWLSCVYHEAECRNGETFAWDGCDIEEDALAKCGGSDACNAAAKKLCDECNFSCSDPDPATCTGRYECLSKCVVSATCADVAAMSADSAYTQCVNACQ